MVTFGGSNIMASLPRVSAPCLMVLLGILFRCSQTSRYNCTANTDHYLLDRTSHHTSDMALLRLLVCREPSPAASKKLTLLLQENKPRLSKTAFHIVGQLLRLRNAAALLLQPRYVAVRLFRDPML